MISNYDIERFAAIGLDGYTITHLARWIEMHRTEEESEKSLNRIYSALVDDPKMIDDHSWAELERMAD